MSPVEFVRTAQGIFDSVEEPPESAEAGEIGRYIVAQFCRWLLSWQGVVVWMTAVLAAAIYDLMT